MKKRSFFASTIAALSLLAGGCIGKSDSSTAATEDQTIRLAENQVLRLNLYSEPPSLNPTKANDSTSFHVLKMLFEGLTRIQPDGSPAAAIAETINVSKDLKTYTFTLRDTKWSNGDPVTAYDFEYAWKEVLNPNSQSVYAYQLYVIKNAEEAKSGQADIDTVGIKALDEKTLKVQLEYPTPYFLELTAFPTYYPIHKNLVMKTPEWANDASDNYICNGPFKLNAWQHHNEIEVVKNDNYWDANSVNLQRINMVMIGDESTELSMFENEELHWAGRPISRLPADAIPSLKENGMLNSQAVAGVEWYKFNTGRFPFNNVKMRKAFSYAINRQTIIDNLMPDYHVPATGIVPKPLNLQEEPFFQDGDAQTARTLFNEALEELGITADDLPVIHLSYNSNEAHHRLAQAIQQQWKESLGVTVDLDAAEWKVHINKMRNHDFQIGRLGWVADFRDPVNFLEVFKFKNDEEIGGNNDTQWESPTFISLLDRSASSNNAIERQKILHTAESLFMDEMPVAPIYFMTDSYVKDPNLKGAFLSGLGDVDFKWAYFESAQ